MKIISVEYKLSKEYTKHCQSLVTNLRQALRLTLDNLQKVSKEKFRILLLLYVLKSQQKLVQLAPKLFSLDTWCYR